MCIFCPFTSNVRVDNCFPFSFGNWIVYHFSIYYFWLPPFDIFKLRFYIRYNIPAMVSMFCCNVFCLGVVRIDICQWECVPQVVTATCGLSEWVSEWLLFTANSAIFQLYHGGNQLIFNEMMMRFALYYTNTLSWIFPVIAHWNNSPRTDMSPHSDTLSWFRAKQSLFFLHNATCLAEKQQLPFL